MSRPQEASITFIGHATVLIEMDGVRLLTDPILRDRVWHLARHNGSVDRSWYQDIDAVLISHLHSDHLDRKSLKLLERTTPLVVPEGAGVKLRRLGFQQITEMAVDDTLTVGSTSIRATYAEHDGSHRLSRQTVDSLGFVIEGSYSIYFAGDTDIFPEMANLVDRLDVALLPVWGWGPTLGAGHLNPYEAAKALQLLRPRLAIPIHWGTFFPIGLKWFMPRILLDPPLAFDTFAAKLAADVKIRIMQPGQHLSLDLEL